MICCVMRANSSRNDIGIMVSRMTKIVRRACLRVYLEREGMLGTTACPVVLS